MISCLPPPVRSFLTISMFVIEPIFFPIFLCSLIKNLHTTLSGVRRRYICLSDVFSCLGLYLSVNVV